MHNMHCAPRSLMRMLLCAHPAPRLPRSPRAARVLRPARAAPAPVAVVVALDWDGDRLPLELRLRVGRAHSDHHPPGAAHAREQQVAADHRPLAVKIGLARLRGRQPEREAKRALLGLVEEGLHLRAARGLLGRVLRALPRRTLHRCLPPRWPRTLRRLRRRRAACRRWRGALWASGGRAWRGRGGGGGGLAGRDRQRRCPQRRLLQRAEEGPGGHGHGHLGARPSEAEIDRRLIGPRQDDVLEAVEPDDALGVELVRRHAVQLHERRLGARAKVEAAHPQLGRPSDADHVVRYDEAVGDLRLDHGGGAEEAEHLEDALVWVHPRQPLPRRVPQLDVLAEDAKVGLVSEEACVVTSERIDRLALVELELVGHAVRLLHVHLGEPRKPRKGLVHARLRVGDNVEPLRDRLRGGSARGRRERRGRAGEGRREAARGAAAQQ
mmetsp:Transcript_7213/g.18714  ORF Transcript_7213/g.18714 Transcript_7213/m.18714 type:complete len:439 (-) Transcript_7213:87-1403(-)